MSEIDTRMIGQICATIMEAVEREFSGQDRECFVRTVALVVEVDSGPATHLRSFCSDDRPWTHLAFLEEAVRVLDQSHPGTGVQAGAEDSED